MSGTYIIMNKIEAEEFIRTGNLPENVNSGKTDDVEVKEVKETRENPDLNTQRDSSVPSEPNSSDEQDVDSVEELATSDSEKLKPRRVYTREERQKHAFKLEKDKRKKLQADLDSKSRELESLKSELEKYKSLSRESFKTDEDYQDYKMDLKLAEMEFKRKSEEVSNQRRLTEVEEAKAEAQRRIDSSFKDENEKNQYKKLIVSAESNYDRLHPEAGVKRFSDLLVNEPDNVVLRYLQDSESSPLLLRHFIMKPDALLKIQKLRDPIVKMIELRSLESRMNAHFRLKENDKRLQDAKKRTLPQTGRISKNSSNNSGVDYSKSWSKLDAEAWLKSHKI